MPRVFVAVNLPDGIKQELSSVENEVQALFPQEVREGLIKWVPPKNLHITLLFLGNIDNKQVLALENVIREIAAGCAPFLIKLKKLSYGPPNQMPPRLIWLDVEDNPSLKEIAETLKKKAGERGILKKNEKRGFLPHITLGRIKTWLWRRMEIEERPEIERDINLSFEVRSIEIMESILKRSGAEYSVLSSVKLGLF
jgi:2'-5' RNA ligase